MPVIYLGLMSVLFLTASMHAKQQATPFHPGRFLTAMIPGAVILLLILTKFVDSSEKLVGYLRLGQFGK